jgi:hypothetical protein
MIGHANHGGFEGSVPRPDERVLAINAALDELAVESLKDRVFDDDREVFSAFLAGFLLGYADFALA